MKLASIKTYTNKKRPTKETDCLSNTHSPQLKERPILETAERETYKQDVQNRHATEILQKEILETDLQKRPTKETNQKDPLSIKNTCASAVKELQRKPAKVTHKRDQHIQKRPTKETHCLSRHICLSWKWPTKETCKSDPQKRPAHTKETNKRNPLPIKTHLSQLEVTYKRNLQKRPAQKAC